MIWLNKEDIIFLHDYLIDEFGGIKGIREEERIESLIELPFLKFEEKELYKEKIEKIARISYALTVNHCFLDGNKRIGALVLTFLLENNDINITFSDDELIQIFINIASNKWKYEDFLKYLKEKVV